MLRALLILVALLAVVGAAVLAYSVYSPYKGFQEAVFLEFPKGTSTQQMADQLAQQGVIRHPWQFLLVRATRPSARLQAGEYEFKQSASPSEVFDRIVRGDIFYVEVTVPEGSNIFDIAAIMDRTGIISSADFFRAAADVSLIKDIAPTAQTLEGYLFPSTYRIVRRTSAGQLVQRMVDQFRRAWKSLTEGMNPPPNVHDMVTLASLVEKETGVPSERPQVASVYANRLRIGMKLDCDPTTIYAAMLDEAGVFRKDLTYDGLHPNDAGYEVMMPLAQKAIDQALR